MGAKTFPPPSGIPVLTHLQWLVLDVLVLHDKPISASRLRTDVAGMWTSVGPMFYQLMKRLVSYGAVVKTNKRFAVGEGDGAFVFRTFYGISGPGREAWQEVLDFYRKRGV